MLRPPALLQPGPVQMSSVACPSCTVGCLGGSQVLAVLCLGVIATSLLGLVYQLHTIAPKVLMVADFVEAHEPQLEYVSSVIATIQNASDNLQLISGSLPKLATAFLVADWGSTAEDMTRFFKAISLATRAQVPTKLVEPKKKDDPFPRWSTKPCFDKCAREEGHFGIRQFAESRYTCPDSHPVATLSETNSGCCAFWTGQCLTCCVSDDAHEAFTSGRWKPLAFEKDAGVVAFSDKVDPEAIAFNADLAESAPEKSVPQVVRTQVEENMAAAKPSRKLEETEECTAHADCPAGEYCGKGEYWEEGKYCFSCTAHVRPGYCPRSLWRPIGDSSRREACCTDDFKIQCPMDPYQCDVRPPGFLDDLSTVGSIVASVGVKLMELDDDDEASLRSDDGASAEEGGLMDEILEGEDGGLLLSFLGHIRPFARQQFQPQEWRELASECLSLTRQLKDVDWMGFYYCRGEANGCAYDFNDDMRDDILPTFDDICASILDLQPLPESETPSECNINMDAVCSMALQESSADCLACFTANEDVLTRVGCDETAARKYCGEELYTCQLGECVETGGTGVPLELCLAICTGDM